MSIMESAAGSHFFITVLINSLPSFSLSSLVRLMLSFSESLKTVSFSPSLLARKTYKRQTNVFMFFL